MEQAPNWDLDALCHMGRDLLLLLPDEETLRFHVSSLRTTSGVGLLDDSVPLLGNLEALENILLPLQYHRNLSFEEAARRLAPAIQALGAGHLLPRRKEELSRQETLACYLLRCVAADCTAVCLPSPRLGDLRHVMALRKKLGTKPLVWIICTEEESRRYGELGLETMRVVEQIP